MSGKPKIQVILLTAAILISIVCTGYGGELGSAHFIIKSDMEQEQIRYICNNAEKYHQLLYGNFFEKRFGRLVIHYGDSVDDFERSLLEYQLTLEETPDMYAAAIPAVFVPTLSNKPADFNDNLLKQVTRHFIEMNVRESPSWFKSELAEFFSRHVRFIDGRIEFTQPGYENYESVKKLIEDGRRLNVRTRLFPISESTFLNWELGSPLAQTFFYWLYEKKMLKLYINNVSDHGYTVETLEKTLNTSYGQINKEINDYYEGDFEDLKRLYEIKKLVKLDERAAELEMLVSESPFYEPARLELLKTYFRAGDYEVGISEAEPLLENEDSLYYKEALKFAANCYFKLKDYSEALSKYKKLWDVRDICHYKYRLAYVIGTCYFYEYDETNAVNWYNQFLAMKYDDKSMEEQEEYAREYIESTIRR